MVWLHSSRKSLPSGLEVLVDVEVAVGVGVVDEVEEEPWPSKMRTRILW